MRSVTVSAVVCCLVFAFFAGCKQNQPPATPQLDGPEAGVPGKSIVFTFSTTDPEKQSLAYLVSWGDGSQVDWDEGYASGEEVSKSHKFTDSGEYVVRVKARDAELAESDWSGSILVAVAFWPPDQPEQPTGPAACTTGVAARFVTKTTHPLGDSVWFQFDWGDTVGDWRGPVAPESVYDEEHYFAAAGAFGVKVRAKDVRNHMSTWSDPLAVSVVYVEAPAKPDVVCEPLSMGAALRLTWGKVANADFYEVMTDDSVHKTTDTTYDVTKACATLEVRAAKGSRKSDPAVVPVGMVETTPVVIYGIGDPDTSHHKGFGIDSAGKVTTYPFYGYESKLDFYADNLTHRDSMFLVSVSKRDSTRGNVLKDAGTGVYDDAKLADTTGYADETLLVVDRVYYLWLDPTNNGWSADDHFAKVKTSQVSGVLVSMQLGYQRVGGLRWLTK